MVSTKFSMVFDADAGALLEVLTDPEDLFTDHPSIVAFRAYKDLGVYELKIRLRRFLATTIETIHFTIRRVENTIHYESLEPGKLRATFNVLRELGTTIVEAVLEYELGLKGSAVDETIKSIFQKALERAERKAREAGIAVRKREESAPSPASLVKTIEIKEAEKKEREPSITCLTCLLYEQELRICTYLAKKVENPEKPPCGGDKYIRAQ